MKKGLTELVFILDKSGSMGGLERDTIGGYNSMLEKQKAVRANASSQRCFSITTISCSTTESTSAQSAPSQKKNTLSAVPRLCSTPSA